MPDLSDAARQLRDHLDLHPAPLSTLTRRSRRRRARRLSRAGLTVVTAAAAVVALAAHHDGRNPQRVTVGSNPTPSASIRPPAITASPSSRRCSATDLTKPGASKAPPAARVTAPISVGPYLIVSPPAAAHPTISASQAWTTAALRLSRGGSYQILLGEIGSRHPTTGTASSGQLVWLIAEIDVALPSDLFQVSPLHPIQTPCLFATGDDVISATNGTLLLRGAY